MKRTTVIAICYLAVSIAFLIILAAYSKLNGGQDKKAIDPNNTETTKLRAFSEIDFTPLNDTIKLADKTIIAQVNVSDSLNPSMTTLKDLFKVVQKGEKIYIMPTRQGLEALSDYSTSIGNKHYSGDTLIIKINASKSLRAINAADNYKINVHARYLDELNINYKTYSGSVYLTGNSIIDKLNVATIPGKENGKADSAIADLGFNGCKINHIKADISSVSILYLVDDDASVREMTVSGSGQISSITRENYGIVRFIPDHGEYLSVSNLLINRDLEMKE